ncbi:YhfZ family protein [Herbiconiux solani]|uniref:YhfZ family protein n=1 Tax=Herbiconiux solani TaxID=661329 RepID=UPI00082673F7|nr:YhfZ family protein [Herbiconiux solani]
MSAPAPLARPKRDVRAIVAQVLLTREVGQRIPTVQELQHTSHAGTGTVIKALRALEANGSVTLSSHGHQGTVVVARDAGQLWNEAQFGNFSLIMPPPGPVEQQGILETVQGSLARQGVPVVVQSLAGARRRLEELYLERADAVVTSAGAFTRHRDDFAGLTSLDLGDATFYSAGSLVVVEAPERREGNRIRVGIDRASYDHQLLTETEFAGQDVEFVEWRFVSAPAAVLRGRVDAAIWHAMPTVISPELAGLSVRRVSESTIRATRDVSRAVLVTRALDAGANALVRAVDPGEVAKAQGRLLRLVAAGEDDGTEVWPR